MLSNPVNFHEFSLIRLTSDYQIKPFDCDDEDLNDFLLNSAKHFSEELLAVTHILEHTESNSTVAFYSMFNDKVSLSDTNNNKWNKLRKKLPNRKKLVSYPAVKLGRLGVNKDFKGLGIGKTIIDFLKIHFVENNRTGCRFLTVDAYGESLGFYEKQGFKYLTDKDVDKDTRQMYYDLYAINLIYKDLDI